MTRKWRLLITPPLTGAWNMAIDEAILEETGSGQTLPTLRLYAWNPPCLSLGYAQSIGDVDLQRLKQLRWDLVRRPTGGRAILHADELTYAVIAPLDDPVVSGSVLESYSRISRGLLAALEHLSLAARADQKYDIPEGTVPGGPVCFEVPSNYEITVQGRKLVGSAQARRRNGVLQHGTLPLNGDLTRITQVLVTRDEATRHNDAVRLLAHATTVETVLGYPVTWEQAAQSMAGAFRDMFDLTLEECPLTHQETQKANQLHQEKYNHPSWTNRV